MREERPSVPQQSPPQLSKRSLCLLPPKVEGTGSLGSSTNADTAPAAPTPNACPAALRTLQRALIQPECETAQRFIAAPARVSQLQRMLCFDTLEKLIRSLSQAQIQPSKEPSVLHTQCQLPVFAKRPVPKSPMGCCQYKCQAPKSQAAAPSQKRKATNSQKLPMSFMAPLVPERKCWPSLHSGVPRQCHVSLHNLDILLPEI